MTQNAISTYADMWVIKEALEKAGKADREAVAEALRTMDGGPSKFYPGGLIKFDEGSPGGCGADHHPVAVGRPGDGVPAATGARAAVLAQKLA